MKKKSEKKSRRKSKKKGRRGIGEMLKKERGEK